LGITECTIHTSRRHIPAKRCPRKAFPLTVKTLGDQIHIKRLEKGYLAKELAEKLGVVKSMIGLWERDEALPNEQQWQLLESLLGLDPHSKPMKSNI
jgi:ribosome-binding protein aMBF1 (putative translation factor)